MARFGFEANSAQGTGNTVGSVVSDSTTPKRGKLYDLIIGNQGTPADNPYNFTMGRCTAAGTGDAVVAYPLDPADSAALADCAENHTVEPTYTAGAKLLSISLNQRATFRWVAYPGGELVYPATAANGLGLLIVLGAALAVDATIHFEEQ